MGTAPAPWQPLTGTSAADALKAPSQPQPGWGGKAQQAASGWLGAADATLQRGVGAAANAVDSAVPAVKQLVDKGTTLSLGAMTDPKRTAELAWEKAKTPLVQLGYDARRAMLQPVQDLDRAQGIVANQVGGAPLPYGSKDPSLIFPNEAYDATAHALPKEFTPIDAALTAGPLAAAKAPAMVGRAALNTFSTASGLAPVRNTVQGLYRVGAGKMTGNAIQASQGGAQLMKVPFQSMAPTAMAAATTQLNPNLDTAGNVQQTPANKFLAPNGQPPGFFSTTTLPIQLARGLLPSWLDPNSTAPNPIEYGRQNLENFYTLGRTALTNFPAFRRAAGNTLTDLKDNTIGFADKTSPANTYDQLSREYRTLHASGQLTPEAQARIRDQVAKLDYASPDRTIVDAAGKRLVADATRQKLEDSFSSWDPRQRMVGDVMTTTDVLPDDNKPGTGMTYPTARDLETAKVRAGQLPGVTQTDSAAAFGKQVDDLYGRVRPELDTYAAQFGQPVEADPNPAGPAAPLPDAVAAQPLAAGGEQPPPVNPPATTPGPMGATDAPPGAQPPPPGTQPGPIGAGDAAIGDATPQDLQAAGQKLTEVAGVPPNDSSFVSRLLARAKESPAPQGFEGYWDKLDWESKALAIGGLSIAAIFALKSMFGSDDEDEEGGGGSWLTSALPIVGLGAAAWGAGGGTFSKLPQLSKYQDLGDSVTGALGLKSLFN